MLASAPSAAVFLLAPMGIGADGPIAQPSARPSIVRARGRPKPLPELGIGPNADDTDATDGHFSQFSGPVRLRLISRVRFWPTRSKWISTPTLRRKVAARRSRPLRARGSSGHFFDFATRSATAAVRTPSNSVAVPAQS